VRGERPDHAVETAAPTNQFTADPVHASVTFSVNSMGTSTFRGSFGARFGFRNSRIQRLRPRLTQKRDRLGVAPVAGSLTSA
jgi:hypothetical protein